MGLGLPDNVTTEFSRPKAKKRFVLRGILIFLGILLLGGGVFAWQTGHILNEITGGEAGIFKSLVKNLPGVEKKLKGEEVGRVNVLLLGMRGENIPGGGLLADTIMVLSVHPKMNPEDQAKASLLSIPRDFYVKVPNREEHRKINAVYALGEERAAGQGGMEDMRTIVGDIVGAEIPYAVTINFSGFQDLVNALGGVKITLSEPFEESMQFREPKVCDPYVFTVPAKDPKTGLQMYEKKIGTRDNGMKYVKAAYPMCYNPDMECGGDFKLPAGENLLDGEKALCFARARYQTSDFERAKRQQQIITAVKTQLLSAGTLSDFSKIQALLDVAGKNVRTNFEVWEMQRMLDLYQKSGDVPVVSKVLDTTEEGLLYHPETTVEAGYILLPRGESYDRIRELFGKLLQ